MSPTPTDLRAERLNRGMSAAEAAKVIGVPKSALLRAERGLGVRPQCAKKIADFLGCKVTDLWPIDPGPATAARNGEAA